MCDDCRSNPIEITEENVPEMLKETTQAALHCAMMQARGWTGGAQGLWADMVRKWDVGAVVRMPYVWGAAMAFLPFPPELADVSHMVATSLDDDTPAHERAFHLAQADQAKACLEEIKAAASSGDLDRLGEIMQGVTENEKGVVISRLLMTYAGLSLHYAHSLELDIELGLFNAHIEADMPQPRDDAEDDQPGGGQ